jgi:hypothetical protein
MIIAENNALTYGVFHSVARTTYQNMRPDPVPPPPICPCPVFPSIETCLGALQDAYTAVLPTGSAADTIHHNEWVERSDLSTFTSSVKFTTQRLDRGTSHDIYYRIPGISRLITGQPIARWQTTRQLLLACSSRNNNVTINSISGDTVEAGFENVTRMLDCLAVPNWRDHIRGYMMDPISVENGLTERYLNDLAPHKTHFLTLPTWRGYPTDLFVTPEQLSTFEIMIKKDPKNVCVDSDFNSYQALQTILFHSATVNLFYGSIFKEVVNRLQSVLSPKVFLSMQKSPKDIERHLDTWIPPDSVWHKFECDFKQFDKSALLDAVNTMLAFYRYFGVEDALIGAWSKVFGVTVARNMYLLFVIMIVMQQKTGSTATALGNFIINSCSICRCFPILEATMLFALFQGDDSLIGTAKSFLIDDGLRNLALSFNLQAKIIFGGGLYFCSSFLVHDGNRWRMVPDPVKRIERLGKPLNELSRQQLPNIWRSLADNCVHYLDAACHPALCAQLKERYDTNVDFSAALYAFGSVMQNYDLFTQLWYPSPDHTLTFPDPDPSLVLPSPASFLKTLIFLEKLNTLTNRPENAVALSVRTYALMSNTWTHLLERTRTFLPSLALPLCQLLDALDRWSVLHPDLSPLVHLPLTILTCFFRTLLGTAVLDDFPAPLQMLLANLNGILLIGFLSLIMPLALRYTVWTFSFKWSIGRLMDSELVQASAPCLCFSVPLFLSYLAHLLVIPNYHVYLIMAPFCEEIARRFVPYFTPFIIALEFAEAYRSQGATAFIYRIAPTCVHAGLSTLPLPSAILCHSIYNFSCLVYHQFLNVWLCQLFPTQFQAPVTVVLPTASGLPVRAWDTILLTAFPLFAAFQCYRRNAPPAQILRDVVASPIIEELICHRWWWVRPLIVLVESYSSFEPTWSWFRNAVQPALCHVVCSLLSVRQAVQFHSAYNAYATSRTVVTRAFTPINPTPQLIFKPHPHVASPTVYSPSY